MPASAAIGHDTNRTVLIIGMPRSLLLLKNFHSLVIIFDINTGCRRRVCADRRSSSGASRALRFPSCSCKIHVCFPNARAQEGSRVDYVKFRSVLEQLLGSRLRGE